MIKIPRLKTNKNGVYCLRVLWRDEDGQRKERQHSLNTKDADIARILALQFNEAFERKRLMTTKRKLPSIADLVQKYELDIAKGVMKADSPEDHALMMEAIKAYKDLHGTLPPLQQAISMTPQATRPPVKSMKFSELVNLYLEEKKLDNNEETRKAKRRTFDDFKDLYTDLEINHIGKPEMVQFKTLDLKRGIKAVRLNARIGQINDLFTWAINNGHYTAAPTSPCDGLRIGKGSKLSTKYESYEPFSNDELKQIFSNEYLRKFHKPDFYWLPILALYTGARREELASLAVADVKTIDGVHCIQIQKGKTADARRIVPIHPKLIELGFLDYANHIRSTYEEFLFPYLNDGPNGKGKNAGRQFSDWLDDIGITDKRKVFHSFRHTFITRGHTQGLPTVHIKQIAGHSSEAQGVHFEVYTHDIGLQELAATMAKITFPNDIELIRAEDPTFTEYIRRILLRKRTKKPRKLKEI